MILALAAISVAAACAQAAACLVPYETYRVDFASTNAPNTFVRHFPVKADLTRVRTVAFDFACEDVVTFSSFCVSFKSGEGCYDYRFSPTVEGRVEHFRIPVAKLSKKASGNPTGLHAIDGVSVFCSKGAPNVCHVSFGNLRIVAVDRPEVLVVCPTRLPRTDPTTGKTNWDVAYSESIVNTFDSFGVPARIVAAEDVSAAMLKDAKLVALGSCSKLPPATAESIREWKAAGGRLLAAHAVPEGFDELLGIAPAGPTYVGKRKGAVELGGFVRVAGGLPGQPPFSRQQSHSCRRVRPVGAGRTLAVWGDRKTGRPLDLPALVVTPETAYLSHVWYGGESGAPRAFMRAIAGYLVPEWGRRFEAEDAAAAAHAREVEARIDAAPGKSGERRAMWCHSAWGLGGTNDWDSSVRFLKEMGFTDLLANLCWGGSAYYESKVLPRTPLDREKGDALRQCLAACRRHGIRLHVWKVCWNTSTRLPPEDRTRYVAEGRLASAKSGNRTREWLCQSDPRNQEQEIEAMCELAGMGVDGIHFDYIRYMGYDTYDTCTCEMCRKRFEEKFSAQIAKLTDGSGKRSADGKSLTGLWEEFRAENISTVVRSVAERVRREHPGVEISAAVLRDAKYHKVSVGQDWGRWCREKWLDFICPMDYTDSTLLFRGLVRTQLKQAAGVLVLPGIGLSCWNRDDDAPEIMLEKIETLRTEGVSGFSVFNLDRHAEQILPRLRNGPLRQ